MLTWHTKKLESSPLNRFDTTITEAMMKTIILPVSMLSALALTACIPLDSDKVGLDFDFASESTTALTKGNFDPTKTKFSASKKTSAGLNGVDISTNVSALANGTSLIKSGDGWDRVQNHPITIGMDIKVSVALAAATSGNIDAATIGNANLAIKGNLGSTATFAEFESDPDGTLNGKSVSDLSASDFIPAGGTIRAIISDGTLLEYATNLLTPYEEITETNLYGAYRNGDQYTAFFAAGTDGTVASTVANKSTASKYDIDFRGMANWGGTDYYGLKGTGNLNVNFNAGTYTGDITVTNDSSTLGEIAFSGSSTNTVTFTTNEATYTPTSQDAVTGYIEGSAYGSDAATFMGTADFIDGTDILVGAYNATIK
ncbi:MAG: hypothetical protein COB24_12090 [Hyphomicrobiales bacterium]|nr:MAG: hypothetical protein COB24_12090 [Hyphomicrobiales bacterium]